MPLERFLSSRRWLAQALTTYDCAADIDPTLLDVLSRGDAERREVARILSGDAESLAEAQVEELLANSPFTRALMSFQLRDLAHVLSLSHGANFSVPGAGKTTVAYACYEAERVRGHVQRLLVVAPLSAFDAWVDEAGRCMDPVPVVMRLNGRVPQSCEVLLVNYQRLRPRYETLAAWIVERPCHLVLDEAHRMKRGRDGEWGFACLELAHLAVRRDILTGTPAPQHPTDFDALMDFLWPHQGRVILPSSVRAADPPDHAMADLSHRLRPLFARTKKDELGLDDPCLRVEEAVMKPIQAEIYDALRTRMRRAASASASERATLGHLGEVVMYLLEAATNPALLASAIGATPRGPAWPPVPVPEGSSLADRIRIYNKHEMPIKFDKLATMVQRNAERERKTLIWSNFVGNLKALGELLAPYRPAIIHGGVPSAAEGSDGVITRETELRRFRHDPDCLVLLANPAAMSEGLSLHETCHDAIYLERTFNAGQYLQSLDRIHRLGLKPGTETRITFLVARNTIDETVDQRVAMKAVRLSQMLSDPNLTTMALPDEDAYGEWVEPDDADALFAHLRAES